MIKIPHPGSHRLLHRWQHVQRAKDHAFERYSQRVMRFCESHNRRSTDLLRRLRVPDRELLDSREDNRFPNIAVLYVEKGVKER